MTALATNRIKTLVFAVLAGLAFWAAFPDLGIWPLGLVGAGLLWNALTGNSYRRLSGRREYPPKSKPRRSTLDRFDDRAYGFDRLNRQRDGAAQAPSAGWNALVGFVAGFVFFGPHVWWASVATALVPWVALTLLQAAFWAVLGLFWAWTLRWRWVAATPWRQALAFAVLFTGVEQWRSSIPFGGFPWGRLAWSVAGATPGRAAWLGGSVLVTFLLAYAASLVAVTAREAFRARRRPGQYQPPTYAPPKPTSAKAPSRFQRLLRPELDLLIDDGAVTASPKVVAEQPAQQSAIKRRARSILVPEHLQPSSPGSPLAASELGDTGSSGPAKTPVSPDLRLVIGGFAALLLLAVPSWFPLPRAAGITPYEPLPAPMGMEWVTWNRIPWVDAGVEAAEAGVLNVGIAQGNVFTPGLPANENADAVFLSHLDATQLLIDDANARRSLDANHGPQLGDGQYPDAGYDIIVWPENAAAWDPARFPGIAAILDDYARRAEAPILIGSMEYPETGGRYNVMLLWEAGEGSIARYAKQIPAPFGEYIPFRTFARMLTDQVDRLPIDMLAGDNPPVITWYAPHLGREVTMGLGICFEVAYDHVFIDAARRGAELLVIPTNNASFGWTAQSTQQLQMTQMQAITTGRAAIQISTVGVSGVFTPDGQPVARTELWQQDRISALMPLRTSLTPAVRLGMAPSYLFQVLALALPLAGLVSSIGRRSRAYTLFTTDQTPDEIAIG